MMDVIPALRLAIVPALDAAVRGTGTSADALYYWRKA
jgi:hypothetical protein